MTPPALTKNPPAVEPRGFNDEKKQTNVVLNTQIYI